MGKFGFNFDRYKDMIGVYQNLVVVGDKKLGIFNVKTCKYITKKIYDEVVLSPFDNNCNIVKNYKENIYVAIVRNDGTFIECPDFENIVFYHNKGIATDKNTQKQYLINSDGKIISKGFDKIIYNCSQYFYGFTFKNKNSSEVKNVKLLDCNGKILPFTFELEEDYTDLRHFESNNNFNFVYSTPNEIKTFKDLIDAVKKYGLYIPYIVNKRIKSTNQLLKLYKTYLNEIKNKDLDLKEIFVLTDIYKDLTHSKVDLDVAKESFDFDVKKFKNPVSIIEKNIIYKTLWGEFLSPMYEYNAIKN